MGRGDKTIYQQQEAQQLGLDQGLVNQAEQQRANLYNQLLPQDEAAYANAGYTPQEQQAMRQALSGSLAGAFGAARGRLLNHAAATGNAAGVNSTEEELAREQSRQDAQGEGSLEQGFAQARIAGQNNALRNLQQLYGMAGQPLGVGVDGASSLIGDQARLAAEPGFWERVLQGVVQGGMASATGMGASAAGSGLGGTGRS